jgi:hypothetical protein
MQLRILLHQLDHQDKIPEDWLQVHLWPVEPEPELAKVVVSTFLIISLYFVSRFLALG